MMRKNSKKIEKIKNFHELVDHISKSWEEKKGLKYYFHGSDLRGLKEACRIFKVWGVMALWDIYLEMENDWTRRKGQSVQMFLKSINWLVDKPTWKSKSKEYESRILKENPDKVLHLFDVSKVAKQVV